MSFLINKLKKAEEHPYITSFALTFFLLIVYSLIQGIYPFGKYVFLRKDMYHQYLPFLTEFRRKLIEGSGLKYSFDLGVGHSFYALYVYYLSDPLNFLTPLIPERFLLEFMTFIVYLKMSLASSFMCRYLRYRDSRIGSVYAILFGICYGLSGYMAAYDWNVMWMWGIALAPLLLLGLEKMMDGDTPLLYTVIMTFIVITNYYIAMVTGVFLIIWFFVLCIEKSLEVKAILRSAVLLGISTLLSAGMSAVLLIPEAAAIRNTSFANSVFPDKLEFYMSIPALITRSFAAVKVETGLQHDPDIYASVLTIIFAVFFFLNKHISLRKKLCRIFMILLFYFSFNTNVLEYIWHGMNYPDSLPARQGFLFIIVCLITAYEAAFAGEEVHVAFNVISFAVPAVLLAVCFAFNREDTHITENTWWFNIFIIALYALAAFIFIFGKTLNTHFCMYVLGLILISELLFNINITSGRDLTRDGYFSHVDNFKTLIYTAELDNEMNQGHFIRFDAVEEDIRNDACLTGYKGDAFFSSTINAEAEEFFEEFGMKSSRVHYMASGLTPFSAAMLADNYILAKEFRNNETDYDIAFYVDRCHDDYLYRYLFELPFGYTIPANDYEFETTVVSDPLDRQNKTALKLGGDSVFERIDDELTEEEKGKAVFNIDADGHYYAYTSADIDSIKEYRNDEKDPHGKFDEMKYNSVMDLGRLEKGEKIVLEADEDSKDEMMSLRIYRFIPAAMRFLTDELMKESLVLTDFSDDHIEGILDISEGRKLLLAMPYDEGWEIEVDGHPYEKAERFYGFLLLMPLEAGVHHISLTYHIPYFIHGVLISILSVIITAVYLRWCIRHRTVAFIREETGLNGNGTE
ncbi:MAG: YfhO family protein [Lachnospiraceae bacterium]|nr:YfhO family protein [Lachnospiraceae bacterium]